MGIGPAEWSVANEERASGVTIVLLLELDFGAFGLELPDFPYTVSFFAHPLSFK